MVQKFVLLAQQRTKSVRLELKNLVNGLACLMSHALLAGDSRLAIVSGIDARR